MQPVGLFSIAWMPPYVAHVPAATTAHALGESRSIHSLVVIGCPVAERARSRRNTARSFALGTSFSIPMQAMCNFGKDVPRSAFPSFVQTTEPPVSAIAKLTPVMPAAAARNFCRSVCRAASVRYCGSVAPSFVPMCLWNSSPMSGTATTATSIR